MSVDLDWLISVDDHVIEPKSLWQDRIPSKLRDRAPKFERDDRGEAWFYDGKRVAIPALVAVAGLPFEEYTLESPTYEQMRPGCYDSVARLEDMDRAGVLASLCFPSFPRFCGQIFWEAEDKELALLCVKAYNDWMVEEWCGSAPGRYVPLTLVPLWDPAAAADEVRRNAERGVRAFAFSENPEPLGLPTINSPTKYWDPLMDACNETGTVVCMHIGSSSRPPKFSADSHSLMNLSWGYAANIAGTMVEWLFSPMFSRFPDLKIALSEGGIGWIPHFLERAQDRINRHSHWAKSGMLVTDANFNQTIDASRALDVVDLDVHQRFRDHIYGCFIDDAHGVANIHDIGIDNVMIEVDYPHSDTSWPGSIEQAHKQLGGLTDDEQYAILRGNAERVFEFTPADVPVTASR